MEEISRMVVCFTSYFLLLLLFVQQFILIFFLGGFCCSTICSCSHNVKRKTSCVVLTPRSLFLEKEIARLRTWESLRLIKYFFTQTHVTCFNEAAFHLK